MGILIEKITVEHVDYYIAGFGVNVLQDNFEEITKAGSIKTQTGLSFDLHQFAEGMHNHFSEQPIQFPSDEEVLARYNGHYSEKTRYPCLRLTISDKMAL